MSRRQSKETNTVRQQLLGLTACVTCSEVHLQADATVGQVKQNIPAAD